MNNIGFIGLGNMGKGMVENLVKNKLVVFGYDINENVYNKFHKINLIISSNLSHLANNCNIIITMLPDGNAVKKVWSELIPNCKSGTVLIDCSTIDVKTSIETQENAKKNNLLTLDAPVSGGQAGAENGTLTIMCGGSKDDFHKAHSVMSCYAKKIVLMGPAGSGQLTKMVNQICIAGLLQGLSEAINFGQKAGLDMNSALDVIAGGAAQSWQMENRGNTMLDDEFDFGFAVDWMRKDLRICMDEAKGNGAELPVTALIAQFYARLSNQGYGRNDTSSLIRLLR